VVEPKIEKPAQVAKPVPVVASVPKKPAPKPMEVVAELEPENNIMGSILASIDSFEAPSQEQVVSEPLSETSELQALLTVLGSRGDSEPEPEAESASTDPAALVALVMELETTPKLKDPSKLEDLPVPQDLPMLQDALKKAVKPAPKPAPVVVPEPQAAQPKSQFDPDGEKYVSTPTSSQKLADLLRKDAPKGEKTLGSFLDGILEDINE
jgi:hypothetical protein